MDVNVLRSELDLDTTKFTLNAQSAAGELRRLERQLDQTSRAVQTNASRFEGIGGTFQNTVITMGALRFALMDLNDIFLTFPKSVAVAAGEIQRLQTLMTGLSTATTDAGKAADGMRDFQAALNFSQSTPFSIKAISDAFVKFKSAGIDPVYGGMQGLLSAVAKFGGNGDTLQRASVAIQQMAGKGVVSMEELRQQLGEAVPTAMQAMATATGLKMAELTKLISSGTVGARSAIAKMLSELELESAGAGNAMLKTLPGALEQLKTQFTLFEDQVSKQGFMTVVMTQLKRLTDFMKSDAGGNFATAIGNGLASAAEAAVAFGNSIGKIVSVVAQFSDELKIAGVALLSFFGGQKVQAFYEQLKLGIDEYNLKLEAQMALQQKSKDLEVLALNSKAQAARQALDVELQAIEAEKAVFAQAQAQKIAAMQVTAQKNQDMLVEALERAQLLADEEVAIETRKQEALAALQAASLKRNPVTGQFQSKSIQDAPRAEVAQASFDLGVNKDAARNVDAIVESRKKLLGAQLANIDATAKETFVEGASTIAHKDNAAALAIQAETQLAAARSAEAAAPAISKLEFAIKGFTAALVSTTLVTGAFFLFMEGAMLLYEKLTGKAREAEEQANRTARALAAQSTADDVKKDNKEKESLQDQLNALKIMRKNATDEGSSNIYKGALDARIADANSKLDQVDQRLKLAVPQLENDKKKSEINAAIARVRDQYNGSDEINKLSIEQSQLKVDQADALKNKDTKTYDAITKNLVDNNSKYQALKLKLLNDGEKAELARVSDPEKRNALIAAFGKDREALVANQALVKNPLETVTKDQPTKERRVSPYEKFIADETVKIADLQSKAKDIADGYVTNAELIQRAKDRVAAIVKDKNNRSLDQLETITDPKTKKTKEILRAPNKEERARAADLLGTEYIEEQANKGFQSIEKYNITLSAKLKETDAIFSAQSSIAKPGGSIFGLDKELAKLQPVSDQIRLKFVQLGLSYDDFIVKMRQDSGLIDIAATLNTTRKATEGLQIGSIEDDRERARVETAYKIDLINQEKDARIAALGSRAQYTDEVTRKVEAYEKATTEYILGLQEELTRKTRSPAEQLALDWSKGMQSMQAATAGWANDFVSKLANGTLKFGDFAKSILTGILEIQLKSTLSNSVGGLLDSASSSISGFLGLGDGGAAKQAAAVKASLEAKVAASAAINPDTNPIDAAVFSTTLKTANATLLETNTGFLGLSGNLGIASSTFTLLETVTTGLVSAFSTLTAAVGGSSLGSLFSGISLSGSNSGALGSLGGAATSLAGTFGSGSASGDLSFESLASLWPFKNGGVMTEFGSLPLKKYLNGGIANRPQLTMFGEGSKPEAYVPLPDGRSIPVTMDHTGTQAPAQDTSSATPQVTINMINQSGTPVQAKPSGAPKFDGTSYVQDIIITGISQPGAMRDAFKNAMK